MNDRNMSYFKLKVDVHFFLKIIVMIMIMLMLMLMVMIMIMIIIMVIVMMMMMITMRDANVRNHLKQATPDNDPVYIRWINSQITGQTLKIKRTIAVTVIT